MELTGISNAGWSFTDERVKQLHIMFTIIDSLKDNNYSYKELQNIVQIENEVVDASKVRMFFPFLRKCDVIDFENEKINPKNYLTPIGEKFKLFLEIYCYIIENERDSEIIYKNKEIFQEFICIFIYNLADKIEIYKLIMEVLIIRESINYDQFFIITTSYINNEKNVTNILGNFEYYKNSENVVNKHKNAWQYIMKLFEESGIVKIEKKTAFLLPEGKKKIQNYLRDEKK